MKGILYFIATLIAIISVLAGLYLSIWIMLVGGITTAYNAILEADGLMFAIGCVKVIFCEVPWIITAIGLVLGAAIAAAADDL